MKQDNQGLAVMFHPLSGNDLEDHKHTLVGLKKNFHYDLKCSNNKGEQYENHK